MPTYSQDGIVLSRVFKGTTDSAMFEDFIEQLLHHCNDNSVLVMNNASLHRSDRIVRMCSAAGVKLCYLPPYSPDLNPIEEFFRIPPLVEDLGPWTVAIRCILVMHRHEIREFLATGH